MENGKNSESMDKNNKKENNGKMDDGNESYPPTPPEPDKELLFLIEFLVDTLTLFPDKMMLDFIDPCSLQGPLSVVLTFLHFPPMKLGETDVDPTRRTGDNVVKYNSGKSLMFALTESLFEEPPPIYLEISAEREMPHAFLFSQLPIGKTKIQLTELFKRVFVLYDEKPGKTVSKSIKDTYQLIDNENKNVAEVSVYIRLTCMGENIVTEFEKNEDPELPLLYKNMDSKKIYECVEKDAREDQSGYRTVPLEVKKYCEYEKEKKKKKNYVPPDPADENYEEIYAEINGSVIRINFEKNRRKDPPKPFHVTDFCDCNIPLPRDLVAGMSDLSLSLEPRDGCQIQVQSDKNLITDDNVDNDPKRVGLDRANQLIFTVPPPQKLTAPNAKTILYNVSTCQNGQLHNHSKDNFLVEKVKTPENTSAKMLNDPEKDVFILRIIKRGRRGGPHEKGHFSLEFKTPKDKIEPIPLKPYFKDKTTEPQKTKKKKRNKIFVRYGG